MPGPILEIGNTNSRYKFDVGARRFVEDWNAQGPAHHCAVGVGHIARKIAKLGELLGLQVVRCAERTNPGELQLETREKPIVNR